MECSELLHSKVLECFIKVNFGYDFLREVVANRTPLIGLQNGQVGTWMESVHTMEQ
jgi:hypothetical protein